MSLRDRIEADLRNALRSGDRLRLGMLRMVKSKMQEREVELRSRHGRDYALDEEEATAVLTAYAKQRRDSIEGFRQGGRDEQAAREEAELRLVEAYLPEQLDEDAIRERVRTAIAETGATSPKDMGAVMKRVMPELRGRADGKLVNRLVQQQLAPERGEGS